MKLTMKRNGEFTCHWINADGMCGVGTELNPRYRYECNIETGDILDKNDFIIDQLDVDRYFQQKYGKQFGVVVQPEWDNRFGTFNYTKHRARSCERIALDAVTDIKNMVETHMLSHSGMSVVYRIAVTISFGDQATMTAEWVPATVKQVANVKKVKPKPQDPAVQSPNPWGDAFRKSLR